MASVRVTSPVLQKPAWKPGEYKADPTSPPRPQTRETRRRKNVASPELSSPEPYSPRPMSPDSDEPSVRTSAIYVHDDMVNMYVMAPDEEHIERIETSTKDKSYFLQVGEPEVRVRSPSLSKASIRLSDIAKSNSYNSLNNSFSSPPMSPVPLKSQKVSDQDSNKADNQKSEPLPQQKGIINVQDLLAETSVTTTKKPPLPKPPKPTPRRSITSSESPPRKSSYPNTSSQQSFDSVSKDSWSVKQMRSSSEDSDADTFSDSSEDSLDSYNEQYIPGSLQNLSTRETVTLTKTRTVAKSFSDISFYPPSFVTSIPKPQVMTRSQTDLRNAQKQSLVVKDIDISDSRTLPKPKEFKPGISLLGLPRPYTSVKDSYGRVQFSLLKTQVNEQMKSNAVSSGNDNNLKNRYGSYPGLSKYRFSSSEKLLSSETGSKSETQKDEEDPVITVDTDVKSLTPVTLQQTTTSTITRDTTKSSDQESDKENVSEPVDTKIADGEIIDTKTQQPPLKDANKVEQVKKTVKSKERPSSNASGDIMQTPEQVADAGDKPKKKRPKSKEGVRSSGTEESLQVTSQTENDPAKVKKKKVKRKDSATEGSVPNLSQTDDVPKPSESEVGKGSLRKKKKKSKERSSSGVTEDGLPISFQVNQEGGKIKKTKMKVKDRSSGTSMEENVAVEQEQKKPTSSQVSKEEIKMWTPQVDVKGKPASANVTENVASAIKQELKLPTSIQVNKEEIKMEIPKVEFKDKPTSVKEIVAKTVGQEPKEPTSSQVNKEEIKMEIPKVEFKDKPTSVKEIVAKTVGQEPKEPTSSQVNKEEIKMEIPKVEFKDKPTSVKEIVAKTVGQEPKEPTSSQVNKEEIKMEIPKVEFKDKPTSVKEIVAKTVGQEPKEPTSSQVNKEEIKMEIPKVEFKDKPTSVKEIVAKTVGQEPKEPTSSQVNKEEIKMEIPKVEFKDKPTSVKENVAKTVGQEPKEPTSIQVNKEEIKIETAKVEIKDRSGSAGVKENGSMTIAKEPQVPTSSQVHKEDRKMGMTKYIPASASVKEAVAKTVQEQPRVPISSQVNEWGVKTEMTVKDKDRPGRSATEESLPKLSQGEDVPKSSPAPDGKGSLKKNKTKTRDQTSSSATDESLPTSQVYEGEVKIKTKVQSKDRSSGTSVDENIAKSVDQEPKDPISLHEMEVKIKKTKVKSKDRSGSSATEYSMSQADDVLKPSKDTLKKKRPKSKDRSSSGATENILLSSQVDDREVKIKKKRVKSKDRSSGAGVEGNVAMTMEQEPKVPLVLGVKTEEYAHPPQLPSVQAELDEDSVKAPQFDLQIPQPDLQIPNAQDGKVDEKVRVKGSFKKKKKKRPKLSDKESTDNMIKKGVDVSSGIITQTKTDVDLHYDTNQNVALDQFAASAAGAMPDLPNSQQDVNLAVTIPDISDIKSNVPVLEERTVPAIRAPEIRSERHQISLDPSASIKADTVSFDSNVTSRFGAIRKDVNDIAAEQLKNIQDSAGTRLEGKISQMRRDVDLKTQEIQQDVNVEFNEGLSNAELKADKLAGDVKNELSDFKEQVVVAADDMKNEVPNIHLPSGKPTVESAIRIDPQLPNLSQEADLVLHDVRTSVDASIDSVATDVKAEVQDMGKKSIFAKIKRKKSSDKKKKKKPTVEDSQLSIGEQVIGQVTLDSNIPEMKFPERSLPSRSEIVTAGKDVYSQAGRMEIVSIDSHNGVQGFVKDVELDLRDVAEDTQADLQAGLQTGFKDVTADLQTGPQTDLQTELKDVTADLQTGLQTDLQTGLQTGLKDVTADLRTIVPEHAKATVQTGLNIDLPQDYEVENLKRSLDVAVPQVPDVSLPQVPDVSLPQVPEVEVNKAPKKKGILNLSFKRKKGKKGKDVELPAADQVIEAKIPQETPSLAVSTELPSSGDLVVVTKEVKTNFKTSVTDDIQGKVQTGINVDLPQSSLPEKAEKTLDEAINQIPEVNVTQEVPKKKNKQRFSFKRKDKNKDVDKPTIDLVQYHDSVKGQVKDVNILKDDIKLPGVPAITTKMPSVALETDDVSATKMPSVTLDTGEVSVPPVSFERTTLSVNKPDEKQISIPSADVDLPTTNIKIVDQVPQAGVKLMDRNLQLNVKPTELVPTAEPMDIDVKAPSSLTRDKPVLPDIISEPVSTAQSFGVDVKVPNISGEMPVLQHTIAPAIQTIEEVKPKIKRSKKKKKVKEQPYDKTKQVTLSDTSLNKVEMKAVLDEVLKSVSITEDSQQSEQYFSCESLPMDSASASGSVKELFLDCRSEEGFPLVDKVKGLKKADAEIDSSPTRMQQQTVAHSSDFPSFQAMDTNLPQYTAEFVAGEKSQQKAKKKRPKSKDGDEGSKKKSKKKVKVQMTAPELALPQVSEAINLGDLPDMSDEGDPWSDSSRSSSLRRSKRSLDRYRAQDLSSIVDTKFVSSTVGDFQFGSPTTSGQKWDVMIIEEIESPERRIEVERIVQSQPPEQVVYPHNVEMMIQNQGPALPMKSPVAIPPLPIKAPVADELFRQPTVDEVMIPSDVSVAGSSTSEPIVTISPARKSKYPPRTVSMPQDKQPRKEPTELPSPVAKAPEVVSTTNQPVMRKSALKKGHSSFERAKSGHDSSADTLDSNGDNPKKKVAIALPHQATPDIKARVSSLFTFEGGPPSPDRTADDDLDSPIMADVVTAQEGVDLDGPLSETGKGPIQLSYIDFFPAKLERQHRYATFINLVDRANIWLEKRPNFVVFRCETVEFKRRSDEDGRMDNNSTSYREMAGRENKFIKGLRLWIRDRISEDPGGPDFLGYFNIIPYQVESQDGSTHYSTLIQAMEYMNVCLKADPMPGKILNVEYLDMKLAALDDELDPDCTFWVEDDQTNKIVYFARVYFKHGERVREDLECVDFVPKITQGSKSLSKCGFESYSGAVKQARDWLNQRKKQYGRLVSVQCINYRATQSWGSKNPDTYQMVFVQGHKATHLIQCLRLTLTKVANEMDVMPGVMKPFVRLYHKSFRPVLLTKPAMCSKITFETFSQTMNRALAWINAAKIATEMQASEQMASVESAGSQVFAIETSKMRVKGGNRTLKPDNSNTALTGEDELVLYFIRIYFDGPFAEPSPEDLPPVPEPSTQDPCCSLS